MGASLPCVGSHWHLYQTPLRRSGTMGCTWDGASVWGRTLVHPCAGAVGPAAPQNCDGCGDGQSLLPSPI